MAAFFFGVVDVSVPLALDAAHRNVLLLPATTDEEEEPFGRVCGRRPKTSASSFSKFFIVAVVYDIERKETVTKVPWLVRPSCLLDAALIVATIWLPVLEDIVHQLFVCMFIHAR